MIVKSASRANKMIFQETSWRIVKVKSLSCIKEMQFLYTNDNKDFSRNTDNLEKYSRKREVSVGSETGNGACKYCLMIVSFLCEKCQGHK